uniref:Cytochrome b n=1 Tax=Diplonema sp. ATCC 50224 TaxID=91375 RepID=A0A2D2AJT8_9EUGL|nr:apocytochrome b [Diplonema sp. ATCC 50224]
MNGVYAVDSTSSATAHAAMYSTPTSMTIAYNCGVLSLVAFGVQVLSGILIACSYAATVEHAFGLLDECNRDSCHGWFIRVLHANSASATFACMYFHVIRNILLGVAVRVYAVVWSSGLLIWLFMMGVAFLGYVLPWGLMSYWALTVITNLITVLPLVGQDVLLYCWGGYYLSKTSLQRVFVLHFVLPLVALVMIGVHIVALHCYGSGSNSSMPAGSTEHCMFYWYYYKDLWVISTMSFAMLWLIVLFPETLHHPDNFCYVDRNSTPAHIVPEWYFLSYYAMLRACPSKLIGVIILGTAIVTYILCLGSVSLHSHCRSRYSACEGIIHVWILVMLGLLGQSNPVYPYVELSGHFTIMALGIHVLL